MSVDEFTDQGAPWWSYREKDAWFDFEMLHSQMATKIMDLVLLLDSPSTDPVLSSGVQVQVKALRVACLLGLTSYDWGSVDRYAEWWLRR